jgi:integrase
MPKARREPVVLTDAKVRSLRPDADEYVQGDLAVPGLGVRVRPSGSPVYVVMRRLAGEAKPRRVTLGRVGDISLADAREKAREATAALRRGVDVNAEKRRETIARKAERARVRQIEAETGYAPGTFGETAGRYIAQECASLRRGAEVAAIIRARLLPRWGDRPIDEMRRRDLAELLDPIIAEGKLQAAHKVREVALRVLNWAADRGDIEINYLASASRGRKRAGILRRSRRDRVLGDDEIRSIWGACDLVRPFGAIVRLALLLGQRRDEIAGMEWAELDLDAGLWVIPAGRYKTGIEHAVPLPASAVALIRSLPRTCDRYVFSTRPGTRFSGYSKGKAALDRWAEIDGWRLHDARRTVRTGLAALRIDPDTAERVLGHVIGGVRGVYDRHAYLDEKRDALERWAAHLAGIINPPPKNVINLRANPGR